MIWYVIVKEGNIPIQYYPYMKKQPKNEPF